MQRKQFKYPKVSGTVYGYKNALSHYICGPLDDCSVEVYATGETLPGDDVDLPYDLLAAMAGWKRVLSDSINFSSQSNDRLQLYNVYRIGLSSSMTRNT